MEDASTNYQAPSIIAAGADAHGVSILTTMINLSLALVCFKAPSLIEKAGLAKRGAIILAFLNLLAWVPLTLAFLLTRWGISSGWFALLWFVNVVPGMLLSFQRDNWLSNIIPHGTLGRYLGQRLAIKSAFYLGAFFALGYILDKLGKDNLAGFAVIFTVAIAVGLIDFIIFTFMGSKKGAETANVPNALTERFGLHEYINELREKKLDTFILFTTFFYLTVGLSGPLYAVFMLNELHFTYLSYTLVISAEYLARVVSSPFWGRYADKAGNIKVLGIVTRVIPFIPICWLFGHNLGYLVFVQILSGTCWGAFDLSTQSYLFKVAPKPKKLRYIVYTRCLVLLCTAVGGLVGAFCVNGIFPTFGSKILSIFWLSGIARALVVLYMMPRLVDLAVSLGKAPAPVEIDHETLQRVLASRHGRFYHRETKTQTDTQTAGVGHTATSELEEHAGKRKWAKHATPIAKPEPVAIVKPANIDMRLEHYRQAMSKLADMKEEIEHHDMGQNIDKVKARFSVGLKPQPVAAAINQELPRLEVDLEKIKARYSADRLRELADIAAAKKQVLAHHEMDMERLKERFKAGSTAPVAAAPVRHEIDRERLQARYAAERVQSRAEASPSVRSFSAGQTMKKEEIKVRSNSGLFQNKVGWARYVKDTLNTALRDIQGGQPVPVGVESGSGVPGGIRTNDLLLRRQLPR